jgi:hypothetical protein
MKGAIARAEELREETPDSIFCNSLRTLPTLPFMKKQPVKRYGMIPTVWLMCLWLV